MQKHIDSGKTVAGSVCCTDKAQNGYCANEVVVPIWPFLDSDIENS